MNQSGVPSPAGGSWPVRQLPITQPGSVYSRSTTPPPSPSLPGRRGKRAAGMGMAFPLCLVWGQSPPSLLDPRALLWPGVCCSCHPPARAHSLGLSPLLFSFNEATASDTTLIPVLLCHLGKDTQTTQVHRMLCPPRARRDAGDLPLPQVTPIFSGLLLQTQRWMVGGCFAGKPSDSTSHAHERTYKFTVCFLARLNLWNPYGSAAQPRAVGTSRESSSATTSQLQLAGCHRLPWGWQDALLFPRD